MPVKFDAPEHHRQTLRDGRRRVAEILEDQLHRRFVIADPAVPLAGRRGHAEVHLLPLRVSPPEQFADNPADHRETVRLLRVEHAIQHGPTRFHMEDFGEFLGVVARHQDVRPLHLVEYVLALQQAFRQLGIWNSEEGVKLRIVLIFLVRAARHHDPAGPDIEAQRLRIGFFGVVHRWSPSICDP